MKFLFAVIFLSCSTSVAQNINKNYDSTLAKSLNADSYGMKKYVLVLIRAGSKTFEKPSRDSLLKGHMQNINKLVSENKLVVAGPMGKNDLNYRGIFILNATGIDEAKQLINTDPAIRAGLFDTDLLIWYGSAALQETLKIHSRIEKYSL